MLEAPRPPAPPLVVAAQAVSPSPETPPPGESFLPPPTAEQVRAADDVFTAPPQRDPAATLLGVLTSVMLLRDVAVDSFGTSAEDKQAEKDSEEDENTEPEA